MDGKGAERTSQLGLAMSNHRWLRDEYVGFSSLVCLRSFDSIGTNKFVFLPPFDS
jgi:hypothetical protein